MTERPYRVYVHDYTTLQKLKNVQLPPQVEIQITLEFAKEKPSSQGTFEHAWDPKITAEVIHNFKQTHSGSKFFASIGGPDSFSVKYADIQKWLLNAQTSLTKIVNDFHLDGIDVYYKNFSPDADLHALEQLLVKLKDEHEIISLFASTLDLNKKYYIPFFETACDNNDIGTVLYQFHKKT